VGFFRGRGFVLPEAELRVGGEVEGGLGGFFGAGPFLDGVGEAGGGGPEGAAEEFDAVGEVGEGCDGTGHGRVGDGALGWFSEHMVGYGVTHDSFDGGLWEVAEGCHVCKGGGCARREAVGEVELGDDSETAEEARLTCFSRGRSS